MNCIRCQGRMAYERFLDLLNGDYAFMGWRCINCGEIRDHLIVNNRSNQAKLTSVGRLRKTHWS